MSTPKIDPIQTRLNRIGEAFLALWTLHLVGRTDPMWGASYNCGGAVYDVEPRRSIESALDGVIRGMQLIDRTKVPAAKSVPPPRGIMMADRFDKLVNNMSAKIRIIGIYHHHVTVNRRVGKGPKVKEEITILTLTLRAFGRYSDMNLEYTGSPAKSLPKLLDMSAKEMEKALKES